MSDKRLIPFSVKNIENNKWSIEVDGNTFEVEGDEAQIRKAILRTKAKDGNGVDRKRSSKKGTYKNMCDGETHYMWKSKAFHNEEEFKSLMEHKDIFEKALLMTEEDGAEFLFDSLKDMSDEEINAELDKYLKYCQTGGEMAKQLPTNVRGVGTVNNMY